MSCQLEKEFSPEGFYLIGPTSYEIKNPSCKNKRAFLSKVYL